MRKLLIVLAIARAALAAPPSLSQTVQAQHFGSLSSWSIAYASSNSTGNLGVVCVSTDGNGNVAATAVSGSNGSHTWTLIKDGFVSGYATRVSCWRDTSLASGANTVTITMASAIQGFAVLHEFASGVAGSLLLDQSGINVTGNASPSVTTTVAAEVVLAFYAGANNLSAGAGWTSGIFTSNNAFVGSEYQIVSSTGTYSPVWTGSITATVFGGITMSFGVGAAPPSGPGGPSGITFGE